MGFVVKWASRMQEQFFLFSGGAGSYFRAGLKKSWTGQKFCGRVAPTGSDIPESLWGDFNVRHVLTVNIFAIFVTICLLDDFLLFSFFPLIVRIR